MTSRSCLRKAERALWTRHHVSEGEMLTSALFYWKPDNWASAGQGARAGPRGPRAPTRRWWGALCDEKVISLHFSWPDLLRS